MIRKYFLLIPLMLITMHVVHAADIISGNTTTTDATFSFPIQAHAFDQMTGKFFVAANPSENELGNANNFALSQLKRTSTAFEPISPQTANINSANKAETNPLYDAGIEFMSLVSGQLTMDNGRPIVVKTGELSTVYFVDNIFDINAVSIFSAPNVPDADGAVTAGIVGLGGSEVSFAFAAVKPTSGGGMFGEVGSGIALFQFGQKSGTTQRTFSLLDAPTGKVVSAPKAVALNNTLDLVKIQTDLASMGQRVALHWDNVLKRLYIGLQVTGGNGVGDGARGVVVGRFDGPNFQQLVLTQIAPDAALFGSNKIVGGVEVNAQISVHQLKTMYTSTALSYLIVLGGNGAPDSNRGNVFALPLVSGANKEINGMIASKNADPVDTFQSKIPFNFIRRDIKEAATTDADMTIETDVAADVGAGTITVGDINEIFVRGDAVFAVVGSPGTNQKPGIFTSQAIFDGTGKIKAWTKWSRVAGTTDQVYGAALDAQQGNFIYLTGVDFQNTTTVKRTKWGNGADGQLRGVSDLVSSYFLPDQGGVQNLFDFPYPTPSLNNISLLVATGLNKIMLIESGEVISSVLCPSSGDFATKVDTFINGTITKTLPNASGDPKILQISGGVLDDIGPIIATEVATNGSGGNQGYLFVGGSGGLAVLSKANGDGWDTATGLGPDFTGLTNGMSFKKVGSYSFVRKLIADGDYLYVLTDKQLDRIDLTQAGIGLGTITPVTVADLSIVSGHTAVATFLDCIVSEKFALLATSLDLFRVGNGNDIRTATGVSAISWDVVPNPEWPNNPLKLIAVSKTGRSQDVAKNDGGHIYVLNAYSGKQRSQINRFAVKPVVGNTITDTTIMPIPDYYVKDRLSYLMNYGELRVVFATDGAMYLGARNRDQAVVPQVIVPATNTEPRTGIKFVGVRGALTLPLAISSGNNVTGMFRNFASGSWLISGDFGLQINE